MYLVRNVFQAKPGKAKELVGKFKEASRYMQREGIVKSRIMTDVVSGFWTVISEFEVPNLDNWEKISTTITASLQKTARNYGKKANSGN